MLPYGLYTWVALLNIHWEDILINFVRGLPIIRNAHDSIFVVVEKFSKTTHFIQYHKIDYACFIINLAFREVVILHGFPTSIVFDKDTKFLSYF